MTASDAGRVTFAAETAAVGPGYHRFVGRLLERLGTDLAITWDRVGPTVDEVADGSRPSPTGRSPSGPTSAGSGPTLGSARDAGRRAAPASSSASPDGMRFTFDGAIATRSGRATTRGSTAPSPTPRVAIGRHAVVGRRDRRPVPAEPRPRLMWLEVRWRRPAVEGRRLRARGGPSPPVTKAIPLDPALAYPWHAWAELIGLRVASRTRWPARSWPARRASRAGGPLIGYRRDPVAITHEGWALEVPGDFAETPDGRGVVGRRRGPERSPWPRCRPGPRRARWPPRRSSSQFARRPRPRRARPSRRRGRRAGTADDRRELRRRGRRPRRLLGGRSAPAPRSASSSTTRRLAVGARPVAVARPGLSSEWVRPAISR